VWKARRVWGRTLLSTAGDFYLGKVAPSTSYYPGQLDEVSFV